MKLTSTDGKLILITKKNAEWNEYVTTYRFEGQLYPDRYNHTDDRQDAVDTAKATMARYEKSTRLVWDGNCTKLNVQDSYYTTDGMNVIHIHRITITHVHLEPEVMVEYKWYEFAEAFGTKSIRSGEATNSLSVVLNLLNCKS